MSEVVTYSPSEVALTFGGYSLEGWDSISVSRAMPSFRQVNGIRGKNSRVRLNNTAANIEVQLPQTSEANYIFQQLVVLDEQYGTGRLNLTLKDQQGVEVFFSSEAFVEGMSDREYSSDITARSWKISCLSSSFSASALIVDLSSVFTENINEIFRNTVRDLF